MSSTAKDHAGEFIKYLGLHEKAKSVSDQIGVTLFALQAVSEIHLLMDGRNDRPGAVRIIHAILGPFLVGGGEEKTGELYDELRKDAHLRPAI